MAEYLEPSADEVEMAGQSRRQMNACIQVGFSEAQAFELAKVWFDRTVTEAIKRIGK